MIKIAYLSVALLVLAGCGRDRVDKVQLVDSNNKAVDPTMVNRAGAVVAKGTDTIPILKLPQSSQLMQVIDPETAEKMGFNRQTIYVVKKTDGSQRVVYMNYNGDPYGWLYLMYIDQAY